MIGILIVSHGDLGEGLIRSVVHIMGTRPSSLECFPVAATDDPLNLLPEAKLVVQRLDQGKGVLLLSDIYGATPSNLAGKLIEPGRVEVVAGVNLPMLVRALTYRHRDMTELVKKAVSGGRDGVVHVSVKAAYAKAGN